MTSDPQDSNAGEHVAPTGDDLAVIVCAYTEERWDDIVAAIASVQGQSPSVGEIVLVVDHNDALMARAREQFTDGVTIVPNRHKRGLSGARNTGIESSSRPIVAFLDDDAFAKEGWVASLLAPYADPSVIGVGGTIDPAWETRRPNWWPEEFDWVVGCTYTGMPTTVAPIRNPIGANMSVRRSVFEAVGGFSSAIGRVGKHPIGGEETELFIRAHQRWPEATAIFQPASAVGHRVPDARARFAYFRARCYAEGLSKAVISRLVGADDGLSSEWDYTLKVLPLAVVRNFGKGLRGDVHGFARGAAVVAGLAATTLGYARGRLAKGPERNLTEVPHSSEAP